MVWNRVVPPSANDARDEGQGQADAKHLPTCARLLVPQPCPVASDKPAIAVQHLRVEPWCGAALSSRWSGGTGYSQWQRSGVFSFLLFAEAEGAVQEKLEVAQPCGRRLKGHMSVVVDCCQACSWRRKREWLRFSSRRVPARGVWTATNDGDVTKEMNRNGPSASSKKRGSAAGLVVSLPARVPRG